MRNWILLAGLLVSVLLTGRGGYAAQEAAAQLQQPSELGRVFTTTDQRQTLDRLRRDQTRGGVMADEVLTQPAVNDAKPEAPEFVQSLLIHMSGTMLRSDGSKIVWLNGFPIEQHRLPPNIALLETEGVSVLRIRTANGFVNLKAGQTLDTGSGQLLDAYQVRSSAARQQSVAEPEAAPSGEEAMVQQPPHEQVLEALHDLQGNRR